MKKTTNNLRNQRVSTSRQRRQQHLLDVKVRSYKFKQQRNRRAILGLCKVTLVVSLLAGLYYGGREGLNRLLWKNPDYNLTNVEINDDGTLSREQILAAAGIVEGRNIFTVNLSKARENLSQLPQVEHAELERILPDKITVTIAERKPIAWLTAKDTDDPMTSGSAFLIDRKGTLIKTKKQLPEYYHLPVIYGFLTDNLEAGEVMDAFEVKSALRLIDLNSDNTRFQVRSVDLSKGYCMVVTDQTHMHITFGLDRVDWQLQRLGMLLDRIDGMNKVIQTANLMVERNVPVTFVQPSPEDGSGTQPSQAQPADKSKDKPTATPPAKKPESHNNHIKKTTPVPVRRAQPVVKHAFGNG